LTEVTCSANTWATKIRLIRGDTTIYKSIFEVNNYKIRKYNQNSKTHSFHLVPVARKTIANITNVGGDEMYNAKKCDKLGQMKNIYKLGHMKKICKSQ